NVAAIDVRFYAVRDTGYLDPVYLNSLISQYLEDFENAIGATIVAVGIDMCKFTTCDNGCQTINRADFNGVVVSANQTVIVGINATASDDCTCPVFRPPQTCQHDVCHNGGVCHNTYPGFFCECRNDFLKGIRCQGTTRSFNGRAFAWYKPMPACTSLNISLSFMTQQLDGILLYNGPIASMNASRGQAEYNDYISIQLRGGQIVADLSFNGGLIQTQLSLPGVFNDGEWHDISLTQIGKKIHLVVDNCENLSAPSMANSTCGMSVSSLDDDERLNIVEALQLGGVVSVVNGNYPAAVQGRDNFNGCIRNLRVNYDLYDLYSPAHHENSAPGCNLYGGACDSNEATGSTTACVHGDCIANANGVRKCICDPGYIGENCETPINWVTFQQGGVIEYFTDVGMFSSKTTDMEILVMPGDGSSDSFPLGSGQSSGPTAAHVATSVGGRRARGEFAGPSVASAMPIEVDALPLVYNNSYWIHLTRNPTRTTL
uniref:LAM_G_DOMAIN domain-containing protein n=1 Tax=Panagrellus redivivus TaxID=6233 RepID=A0A7E5A1B4_PANRE